MSATRVLDLGTPLAASLAPYKLHVFILQPNPFSKILPSTMLAHVKAYITQLVRDSQTISLIKYFDGKSKC